MSELEPHDLYDDSVLLVMVIPEYVRDKHKRYAVISSPPGFAREFEVYEDATKYLQEEGWQWSDKRECWVRGPRAELLKNMQRVVTAGKSDVARQLALLRDQCETQVIEWRKTAQDLRVLQEDVAAETFLECAQDLDNILTAKQSVKDV